MPRRPAPWRGHTSRTRRPRRPCAGSIRGSFRRKTPRCGRSAEDYMKASGNKLDYSIMPFMALNQKTISALTSGDVPDLVFMDAPATILPQNAWDDKIVDVTDVVAPYEVAAFGNRQAVLDLLQQGDQEAQLLPVPDQAGRHAVPYLGRPGREGRAQDGGNPQGLGRDLDLPQADAGAAAFQGHAEDLSPVVCRSPRSDRTTATTCSRIS